MSTTFRVRSLEFRNLRKESSLLPPLNAHPLPDGSLSGMCCVSYHVNPICCHFIVYMCIGTTSVEKIQKKTKKNIQLSSLRRFYIFIL